MSKPEFVVTQRVSIWDIIFFMSLGILTLWLILKLTGVIQTPVWLEFGIPIATVIIGFGSLYTNLLEKMNHVAMNTVETRMKVEHMQKELDFQRSKIEHIEKEFHTIKKAS